MKLIISDIEKNTFLCNILQSQSKLPWVCLTHSLRLQVSPDQMVQAQGPLEVYHRFHEKFCLVVGQGKIVEIAREYPFNVTAIIQYDKTLKNDCMYKSV